MSANPDDTQGFPAPQWTAAPDQAQPQESAQVRPLHPSTEQPTSQPATSGQDGPPSQSNTGPQTRREARTGDTSAEPRVSIQALLDDFERGGDSLARPESGFRRLVYDMTGGRMNPGPSAEERMREELVRRIRTPLANRSHHVMFWSAKGGVGKTTTTVAAGVNSALYRSDKNLALDTNSDGGSLAVRVPKRTKRTILDLRDTLRQGFLSPNDFDAFVNESASTRLDTIVMPPGKWPDEPLTGEDYVMIANALRQWYPYKVIYTDCGTSVSAPVTSGILACTDQMVVVTSNIKDDASVTAGGLEALVRAGWGHLVRNSITALVEKAPKRHKDPEKRAEVEQNSKAIKDWFGELTSQVVTLPYDESVLTGGVFEPKWVSDESQIAHLALTASIIEALAEDRVGRNPQ